MPRKYHEGEVKDAKGNVLMRYKGVKPSAGDMIASIAASIATMERGLAEEEAPARPEPPTPVMAAPLALADDASKAERAKHAKAQAEYDADVERFEKELEAFNAAMKPYLANAIASAHTEQQRLEQHISAIVEIDGTPSREHDPIDVALCFEDMQRFFSGEAG